jgi:hypothetical protein
MKVSNILLAYYAPNLPDGFKTVANLSFRDPKSLNPYIVKAISGLDATEIKASSDGRGSFSPGNIVYSMFMPDREITLRVALNPNYSIGQTISSLRDEIYKAISGTELGKLQLIFSDTPLPDVNAFIAYISGFITKLEVEHFSETPELQLTVSCSDPMIKSLFPESIWTPNFEDPGEFTLTDNLSTAPHGVNFAFFFNGPTSSFTIKVGSEGYGDTSPLIISPGYNDGIYGFQNQDVLTITTDPNKSVVLSRDGSDIHLMDKVSYGSNWPKMHPGNNTVTITSSNYTIQYIDYTYTYWGI